MFTYKEKMNTYKHDTALSDGDVTYLCSAVPPIWTVYQNRGFVILYFIYDTNSSS